MRAVVDEDVELGRMADDLFGGRALVDGADNDVDAGIGETQRRDMRIDVAPDEAAGPGEVLQPDLKGAAVLDADLHQVDGAFAERAEHPVVDVEIELVLVRDLARMLRVDGAKRFAQHGLNFIKLPANQLPAAWRSR